jgi:hypothetical protein
VKLDWLHRRVREISDDVLRDDADAEFERLLVGDAVVTREGNHYRIESGDESWAELERLAEQASGRRPARAAKRPGADRADRLRDRIARILAARRR